MRIKLRYNRNAHQAEFHEDMTTKLLHLSTGFSGGKSYGLVMKSLQLSIANRNTHGGLLCPTYGEFKRDMYLLFEEILETNRIAFNYHKTDHYFSFPWTTKKLWVASAENKLRGPNWGWAVINELTLCPIVRYREVMGRVRDKKAPFAQIASVGTPEGIASDYYSFFIEQPPVGITTRIIYGDTRANIENISPEYIPMLEAAYDEKMLEAYLKGLWVNMTANTFYYSFDPHKNEDRTLTASANQAVHIAMDFNVDYMTATVWTYDGVVLRGVDEVVLPQNADTKKMCDALKARGYYPARCTIYPDPAAKARSTKGQPDATILRNEGFTEIRMKSMAPTFRKRQLNVNNLLAKGVIKFNPDKMPALKKDLVGVSQNAITLEKDKSNPKLTHASDGVDYMTDILFPLSGEKPQAAQVVRVR